MRRAAWRPPPWHATFVARLRFQSEVQTAVPSRVTIVKASRRLRGGFALSFTLVTDGVAPRRVRIEFDRHGSTVPRVFVDGPIDFPHRYENGSLCMWYPPDPPHLRWSLSDGGAALVGCIALHLLREQWWRDTGEWVGPEAPHAVRSERTVRRAA